MDLSKLTAEDRANLKAQMAAEEAAEKQRIEDERNTYKELVDNVVAENAELLQELSATMMRVKQRVFENFESLIETKNELYKVKGDRPSDTFTTSDSRTRITLGNRMNEGWDDTVEAGIEKVKEYLSTLARDDNSAAMVGTVRRILAKDAKGRLKASKVLELEKLAIETRNADFSDATAIIKKAYRPVPT